MNSDVIQGSMKELKGELKQTWSKLTDDDINSFDGGIDKFIGKVQKTYGISKERAMEEFDRFKTKNEKYFDRNSQSIKDSFGHSNPSEFIQNGSQVASQYFDKVKHVGSEVANRTQGLVREKPGYTLLGAAAIGFIVGAIMCGGRRNY